MRSSPGPKTGCSPAVAVNGIPPEDVAILTRSEDRVQPAGRAERLRAGACCDPHPVRRPGAASAPLRRPRRRRRCDPHPVRRPGAARSPDIRNRLTRELRSSPGPKTGCSGEAEAAGGSGQAVAILTRSEDRVQPVVDLLPAGTTLPLRSSPGPKTGCSDLFDHRPHVVRRVAILTRSEDRVQHAVAGWSG